MQKKTILGEFQSLLKYCKNLKFEEDPNYSFIKEQLKNVFTANTFTYDLTYDWTAHAAAAERKSTFMHLADRQHQLAKMNSVKKNMGSGEQGGGVTATEEKKDWRNSKMMKNSMPQLMRSPGGANEQNSMMVNYTSCIQEASSKGQQEHGTVHPPGGEVAKGPEPVPAGDQKEKKKCCCMLL